MPLYNKAPFVVEALESILSQTYAAHEIIVVDDGSTDDGVSLVESLAHPAIRLIQQRNAGVAAARNTGVQAATGDFIAFLDADDRYLPGFLTAINNLAHDFPSAGLLATAFRRFSDGRGSISYANSSLPQLHRGLVKDFYAQWCRGAFVSASSLAIRTTAFRESGIQFPAGERLGEDQDVWFRMAERYPLAYDPTVYCEYRVNVSGSATHAAQVVDLLPCYQRLAGRLQRKEIAPPLVCGAQRLLASHYLNVARARLSTGDINGASQLVLSPVARANPTYLLRTLALVGLTKLKLRPPK